MKYKKQNDCNYKQLTEFRKTNKYYCNYCKSYTYIKDSVPVVLCHYCRHYIFNTNNPEGKRMYFKYKLKECMKK